MVNHPSGPHKHFKGGHYNVVFVAKDCETQEDVVVYASLTTGDKWVRPLKMWNEEVEWPDGIVRPRFIPHDFYLQAPQPVPMGGPITCAQCGATYGYHTSTCKFK